jgi:hypothetical protein
MPVEKEDILSLISVLKERPELLKDLNRSIAEVMEAAGVEQGDLDPAEVLEMLKQSDAET